MTVKQASNRSYGFPKDEIRQRKYEDNEDTDEQAISLPPGLYDMKKNE